jgi:hypothetical protein
MTWNALAALMVSAHRCDAVLTVATILATLIVADQFLMWSGTGTSRPLISRSRWQPPDGSVVVRSTKGRR